jgi:four helix bundle protein
MSLKDVEGEPLRISYIFSVSLGSSFELETQIILSLDLGYLDEEKFETLEDQIHQVQKMLNGLITNLESKLPNSGS